MRIKSPEYRTWQSMKTRCYNARTQDFKNYGGRGISVCATWRNDFRAFLADMGQRPPGMSIDRIDNDGHYEPGNCRWATRSTQNHNSRNAKLTASDVEAILGLLDEGAQQRVVAKRFGVSQRLVLFISKGEAWPEVVAAHVKRTNSGDLARAERHRANLTAARERMWREMPPEERARRLAAVRAKRRAA